MDKVGDDKDSNESYSLGKSSTKEEKTNFLAI